MAAWLPIIKAAVPHIAQIVTASLPIFTSKFDTADRDALIDRQIGELQQAATHNAESVRELATQLQTTFESLEAAGADLQRQLKRQQQLMIVILIVSIVAMGFSVFALAGV